MGKQQFFRANVGLAVIDGAGRVLALERREQPGSWQLPQGGLDGGEEPAAAAWRELAEETGLTADDVELVAELDEWLAYELPTEMRSAKTGRGQVQRWFAFRLRREVELRGDGKEAAGFAWMTMEAITEKVIEFRRPIYRKVAAWLGGGA